jgi:uncharacterized protein (DUF4213/DUF364 family)
MPADLYDWLTGEAQRRCSDAAIERVLLGLNWSAVQTSAGAIGLCFSPVETPRTLPWPGTLRGRSVSELAGWIRHQDACESVVGCATVNAALNGATNARSSALRDSIALPGSAPGHLHLFEHFRSQVDGSRVAVIGRYPGLDQLWAGVGYQCIERRPQQNDLPEAAADHVLSQAHWVFITASSIANKTLPHLLALAKNAKVVLMGPSLPWLYAWADFGVTYLAGIEVCAGAQLFDIAAEGGGTRIFDEAVRYRLLEL